MDAVYTLTPNTVVKTRERAETQTVNYLLLSQSNTENFYIYIKYRYVNKIKLLMNFKTYIINLLNVVKLT